MNALVRIEGERAVADSRDVAEQFGKAHKNVLRAVQDMMKDRPELGLNFEPKLYAVQTANGATRNTRRFDMDRKGFMLLVMGFNGAKALEIKSRWIDAFDAMERALLAREQADNDEGEAMELPPLHQATRIASLGETYRRIYGARAAQWIMVRYGMPTPPAELIDGGEASGLLMGATAPVPTTVVEWMGQCCEAAEGARESATTLYGNYQQWCAEQRKVPETQTGFGRALSRCGIAGHKTGTGRVWRRGLRLLAA